MMKTAKQLIPLLLALVGAASAVTAQAQPYPNKPIRIVLGFAPGAITDTIARSVGARLSKNLGQPVVIDNRAGGGGTIASEAVAKAAPDGYTILLGEAGGMSINPLLIPNLSYNVTRDFVPIGQVVNLPLVLVANPSTGLNKLSDLAAYGVANKSLNYGSPGPGTIQHLSMELFKTASALPFEHIPYKGGAPAMTDLLAGQIPLMIITVPTVAAQVKTGKITPLVILGKSRSGAMPQVPTVGEAGYPGLPTGNPWQGFFAPANTPRDIVVRLNAEIRKALESPDVRDNLVSAGADIVVGSPEDFAKMLREESVHWAKAIQVSGVKAP